MRCFVYLAKALDLKYAKFRVRDTSRLSRSRPSKVASSPITSPKCLRVGCVKTRNRSRLPSSDDYKLKSDRSVIHNAWEMSIFINFQ